MINEARILLEAAAAALELPNPDIAVIRALIKDADELLAKASNEQADA